MKVEYRAMNVEYREIKCKYRVRKTDSIKCRVLKGKYRVIKGIKVQIVRSTALLPYYKLIFKKSVRSAIYTHFPNRCFNFNLICIDILLGNS